MLRNEIVENNCRYREKSLGEKELSNAKQGNSWDRKCVSTKKERKVTKRKKERLELDQLEEKLELWMTPKE